MVPSPVTMPSMLASDCTSSKPYRSLSRTMARTQYGSTPRRICATRFPASPAIMHRIVAGDDRAVNRGAGHGLTPTPRRPYRWPRPASGPGDAGRDPASDRDAGSDLRVAGRRGLGHPGGDQRFGVVDVARDLAGPVRERYVLQADEPVALRVEDQLIPHERPTRRVPPGHRHPDAL